LVVELSRQRSSTEALPVLPVLVLLAIDAVLLGTMTGVLYESMVSDH